MRVLVVEDAARLANWIAEGLRDEGIAVDIAYDGTEAASRLHVNPYDVVVLDRDLPGIHGDTLCRMITESDEPAMILILTAAGTPDDRVAGLTLGADDYLPKPFHFPELVLRVRALGRRKPTAQPRTLRACGIELDPLNEGLYRGLMLCHQELGDHSDALHAYRRCRELLTRFLGVPPNAKTQALYHSVRERAACATAGSAL